MSLMIVRMDSLPLMALLMNGMVLVMLLVWLARLGSRFIFVTVMLWRGWIAL